MLRVSKADVGKGWVIEVHEDGTWKGHEDGGMSCDNELCLSAFGQAVHLYEQCQLSLRGEG